MTLAPRFFRDSASCRSRTDNLCDALLVWPWLAPFADVVGPDNAPDPNRVDVMPTKPRPTISRIRRLKNADSEDFFFIVDLRCCAPFRSGDFFWLGADFVQATQPRQAFLLQNCNVRQSVRKWRKDSLQLLQADVICELASVTSECSCYFFNLCISFNASTI